MENSAVYLILFYCMEIHCVVSFLAQSIVYCDATVPSDGESGCASAARLSGASTIAARFWTS